MDVNEYEQFTKGGEFTFKRTDKFWSGTWSDQMIEQTLNREFKIKGGAIGRGITDSSLTSFTMPILHNICEAVEVYSETQFSSSEQHVKARESRIERDDKDVAKLLQLLDIHNPFPISDAITSLSTGVKGDKSSINCFRAREIGELLVEEIQNKMLKNIKIKRSKRVLSLDSINCSVKVCEKQVTVDPLMLFQRITVAKKSEADLQEFLKYELAPYPLSLFCENGMRKNKKSMLTKVFEEFGDNLPDVHHQFVIDGGFLLHRVVWSINTTYRNICTMYINYVKQQYGNNCIIVFDGYDNTICSTKKMEQVRRDAKHSCPEILFEEHMVATIAQDTFLRNNGNKARLISLLQKSFQIHGFRVKQAISDADVLIIQTAVTASATHCTVVVGEDTDLLVLLAALIPSDSNIFFLKPGRGKSKKQIFSSQQLQKTKNLQATILLAHVFSDCDTTSAIFQKGKNKVLNLLKNKKLQSVNNIFMSATSKATDIKEAGELFLHLYGSKNPFESNLNALRYDAYRRSASNKTSCLPALPPTSSAAAQHSFSTYHQVQTWLGSIKNPESWSWQKIQGCLQPVTTTDPPAPNELLKLVACNCRTNCAASCGCKKAGLKCSDLCGHCIETGCLNMWVSDENSDTDEFDEEREEEEEEEREQQQYNLDN